MSEFELHAKKSVPSVKWTQHTNEEFADHLAYLTLIVSDRWVLPLLQILNLYLLKFKACQTATCFRKI